MNNGKYEAISERICEISTSDDASEIINEIEELYQGNEITNNEKEILTSKVHEECMFQSINLGIDDYDWEEMKLFDPNLSEQ